MVFYPQWMESKKLLDEVNSDPTIQKLLQEVLADPSHKPGFSVKQGVLFYQRRLVLSPKSPSIPLLLEEYHSTPAGGHSGFLRTYRRLADNLYWVGMQKYVRDFVRSIAELFVKEIVRPHGIPKSLLSDREPLFVSNFWLELFKLQGTKLNMSSAYHPETDGQTEVINRCLESYLRCFASDQPKLWATWISWAEFLSNETKVDAVALELKDRDEALSQLKAHLQRAQEQMASYANKKRRDLSFTVGEWVFLKLRPRRQHSVVRRIHQKLAARFYGPFKVIAKVVQGDLPQELEVTDAIDVYPELVIGSRITVKEGGPVQQSLIKWKNKSLEDVTWEDNEFLRGQFPEFSLEDKTVVKEGRVDGNMNQELGLDSGPKPRIWRVYVRKKGSKEKMGKNVMKGDVAI
ncbi:hypothetical protein A2U01_0003593 [Trifolium medium]|uniref:Integrase catalytic domain-containing protein n=1 Tax=Trifolium medium TaxID=97028 RepID=A0A392M657_9FABA|nr:hypothetical protein [Trifolium medium]